MKTIIASRKLELTDGMRDYIQKKLSKLDKFFGDDAEARVTVSVEKDRQKVEATIYSQNTIFRVEEITEDMYKTMDKVISSIERKIRKNKSKLEKRMKNASFDMIPVVEPETEEPEEKEFNVVKRKLFTTKPMSSEEAILQMNLLGHAFYVFKDAETAETNIVYKRKDGNYGIIEVS